MVLAIYLTLYNNAVRPVKRKGWHITHDVIIPLSSGADPGFKKNCAERREARKFWGYFV
jgi:hypothetical protein